MIHKHMLWSALLRGGSNKDDNKCLMIHALMRTRRMCLCWLRHFFLTKKNKNVQITIASFKTAHIDWSGIRILGASRLNIKARFHVAVKLQNKPYATVISEIKCKMHFTCVNLFKIRTKQRSNLVRRYRVINFL